MAEFGRATTPNKSPKARATWKLAPLTFDTLPTAVDRAREKLADKHEFVAKLETRGQERALIYKSSVLTGLRRNVLASLTIGSLVLDAPYAKSADFS